MSSSYRHNNKKFFFFTWTEPTTATIGWLVSKLYMFNQHKKCKILFGVSFLVSFLLVFISDILCLFLINLISYEISIQKHQLILKVKNSSDWIEFTIDELIAWEIKIVTYKILHLTIYYFQYSLSFSFWNI